MASSLVGHKASLKKERREGRHEDRGLHSRFRPGSASGLGLGVIVIYASTLTHPVFAGLHHSDQDFINGATGGLTVLTAALAVGTLANLLFGIGAHRTGQQKETRG